MTSERSNFGEKTNNSSQEFNTLLDKPKQKAKKITIKGEMNFGNDALSTKSNVIDTDSQIIKDKKSFDNKVIIEEVTKTSRRGRPVKIKDSRYKVNKPKMISAALESKLAVLQDYVEEFQDVSGRITFEKYIDTLAESYITRKLGIAREERLREELQEHLDKLKK